MAERYAYCGILRRSTSPGDSSNFEDICYVIEPQHPRAPKTKIALEDTGDCVRDGGYGRSMPSPLRTHDDLTFTINYDPNNPQHKKIFDDYAATQTSPDTHYYWQWYDTSNQEVWWTCKGYVLDCPVMAGRETPQQMEFTLALSGKPLRYAVQDTP